MPRWLPRVACFDGGGGLAKLASAALRAPRIHAHVYTGCALPRTRAPACRLPPRRCPTPCPLQEKAPEKQAVVQRILGLSDSQVGTQVGQRSDAVLADLDHSAGRLAACWIVRSWRASALPASRNCCRMLDTPCVPPSTAAQAEGLRQMVEEGGWKVATEEQEEAASFF